MLEQVTNAMEANEMIEKLRSAVQQGLMYLIQLTNVPEDELFKICIEFWHWFCNDSMIKTRGPAFLSGDRTTTIAGMTFSTSGGASVQHSFANSNYLHTNVYPDIYRLLRIALIDHMTKPKEVLLNLDEYGEIEEDHF